MAIYKYGYYCEDVNILKTWTESDYLINNQQIVKSKKNVKPLAPLTSRKNIAIKYFLYGLMDLVIQTKKTKFVMNDIVEQIKTKKDLYDYYILLKVNIISERIIKNNYNKSAILRNNNFDYEDKIKEKKEYNQKQIQFKKTFSVQDIYCSAYLLLDTFVNLDVKTRKSEGLFNNKYIELYSFNDEGKKLMKLIKEDNYLI